MKSLRVLALDLEITLISNALSQIPRPGLFDFLEECQKIFERLVIFTTVKEEKFRTIAKMLVAEEAVPSWFERLEYIEWSGNTKNLNFISGIKPEQALLLDDLVDYVHPGQESQWISIKPFESPYSHNDNGLMEALLKIKRAIT